MIETRPAANATGSCSSIEARELLVDAPIELGVERRDGRRLRHCVTNIARPGPAPRAERKPCRGDADAAQRKRPREQVEAVLARHAEDARAELVDELLLDLRLRRALRDAAPDLGLHLACDWCVRLVERGVAGRADELALELALRRVPVARERRRRRGEQRDGSGDGDGPHDRRARRMPSSSCSRVAAASTCGGTTRPLRSTKNVSGSPVTPHLPSVDPGPSRTIVYATSWRSTNRDAALRKSFTSTPTKTTPLSRQWRAAAFSAPASFLHPWHHEAQKLTTTTFPRCAARSNEPSRSWYGSTSFGAATTCPWSTFFATLLPSACAMSHTSKPSSATTTATASGRSSRITGSAQTM